MKTPPHRRLLALAISQALLWAASAQSATIVVTSSGDDGNPLARTQATLRRLTLTGGVADTDEDGGGAIRVSGEDLRIIDSTLTGNSVLSPSQGINLNYGGAVSVRDGGSVRIENSTIHGNSAERGAGLACDNASVSLLHATISGGMDAFLGDVFLNNCSLDARNSILRGGGCGAFGQQTRIDITTDNIVARSFVEPCGGDGLDIDPMLGPLANNGGPTFTRALTPGSPAIDLGDDAACDALDGDQRGRARREDGDGDGLAICDPGAYEAPRNLLFSSGFEE